MKELAFAVNSICSKTDDGAMEINKLRAATQCACTQAPCLRVLREVVVVPRATRFPSLLLLLLFTAACCCMRVVRPSTRPYFHGSWRVRTIYPSATRRRLGIRDHHRRQIDAKTTCSALVLAAKFFSPIPPLPLPIDTFLSV